MGIARSKKESLPPIIPRILYAAPVGNSDRTISGNILKNAKMEDIGKDKRINNKNIRTRKINMTSPFQLFSPIIV